jgi:cellulose synthase/poly-beta-1,6-N-acetylglucosamine synthase-like glycosyltransferase/peptidoglycan/xylan/chitin deacetylase (PgdA/CDA1 family)
VSALTVLVPSFREEERVVRQTLMSAALLEYPRRRVVLLIDDSPTPFDASAAAALACMRALPAQVELLLQGPGRRYRAELEDFERRTERGSLDLEVETRRVASLYEEAAIWLEQLARAFDVSDHTDKLFVERILREPARAHRARSRQLRARVGGVTGVSARDLLREHRRLAALFAVELTTFERKRFANLSHAPNKAMNLNSYIGLLGRAFRAKNRLDGVELEECALPGADVVVPPADYVITVDADSLLLHDYAIRLTHVMRQPENQRVGVVQTPYVSVPGSPIPLERAAGAQADLQWMMGQGSTYYDATFWIGASALLRYKALEDICEVVDECGYRIKKFIRDGTLTEDTESTVDLIAAGRRLHNYPDQLSYSATPRDFGALVIQRRRWANGGLLILPRLLRYLKRHARSPRRLPEAALRTQYLVSTAAGNVGLLVLLVYPFGAMYSNWLFFTALSYLVLYSRDLMRSGYSWLDVGPLYALNLLLVPVNLGGVANSLQQLWTGRPAVFARTPKVTGRTAVPALYITMNLALVAWLPGVGIFWLRQHRWPQAIFPFISAIALGYALFRFVGIGDARDDLIAAVRQRVSSRTARDVVLCVSVASLGLASCGRSPDVRAPGIPRSETRQTRARAAAVTFDDVPVVSVAVLDAPERRELTERLLATLRGHGVPAVGFVNEAQLYGNGPSNGQSPGPGDVALLRRWLDSGLELGNHTFAHLDLHKVTLAEFEDDIVRGEAVTSALLRARGRRLRYFRHPYLNTGRDLDVRVSLERFLTDRGYRVAPVTVDPDDYVFAAVYSKAAARGDADLMGRVAAAYVEHFEETLKHCEQRSVMLFGREILQIVLLHANRLNADLFERVAVMMERRGYSFIPLDTALDDEAYSSPDGYVGDQGLDWLARWAITRGLRNSVNVFDDSPDIPRWISQAARAE